MRRKSITCEMMKSYRDMADSQEDMAAYTLAVLPAHLIDQIWDGTED